MLLAVRGYPRCCAGGGGGGGAAQQDVQETRHRRHGRQPLQVPPALPGARPMEFSALFFFFDGFPKIGRV